MDDQRFDDLTRRLASTASRRTILGGAFAALAGAFSLRTAANAQVSQAYCGNLSCKNNPGKCKDGCVCCDFGNGNSRCRPPDLCPGGPTTTTTPAPTTTSSATTTTAAPSCANPATNVSFCAQYPRCGESGPLGCVCGTSTAGVAVCFERDFCDEVPACDANTPCASGVCIASANCCGGNRCYPVCGSSGTASTQRFQATRDATGPSPGT